MNGISMADFCSVAGCGLALGLVVGLLKACFMRSSRSLFAVSKMVLRQ